jgi:hypothetical protein
VQARWQLAGPLVAVFSVDREHVLAADREQPLHDDVAVLANEASIANDSQWLTDQRCEPKLPAEAVERRTANVLPADQGTQHSSDHALTPARRTNHEQDFV